MRFHRHVPKERRVYLKELLLKYEKEKAITLYERKDLYSWVASGKSPYENGYYYYYENGSLMDFVDASRFNEELCHMLENMSDEEREEYLGRPDDSDDFSDQFF